MGVKARLKKLEQELERMKADSTDKASKAKRASAEKPATKKASAKKPATKKAAAKKPATKKAAAKRG
jgi:hypothetical protein